MMIDELQVRTAQQGIRYEDYLRVTEKTEDGLRVEYREGAEHRVKVLLVLGAIADKEDVSVSDADVEAEIKSLRSDDSASPTVAEYLDSDRGRNYVRSQLRRSQVVEMLIDRWIEAHPEFKDVQHQHQPHGREETAATAPDLIDEAMADDEDDEADDEMAALEAAAVEGANE